MAHVVTEPCILCKYTDCVDVCPVDCFREGPNFLVIDPDECIDCAVCIPECPTNAIMAEEDVPEDQQEQFTSLLSEYCEKLERQAFDVGFKTAVQLWQQLDNTEEIYGGITK